jgi:hypothetical protein
MTTKTAKTPRLTNLKAMIIAEAGKQGGIYTTRFHTRWALIEAMVAAGLIEIFNGKVLPTALGWKALNAKRLAIFAQAEALDTTGKTDAADRADLRALAL